MNIKNIIKFMKETAVKLIEFIFSIYVAAKKNHYKKRSLQNKVLVICNDHIGDTVVRIEYLNEFINKFGYDNVIFVSSKVNAEIIKLVSKNVITYDARKYRNSLKYKVELFNNLNREGFSRVVSLVPYKRHQSDIISNLVIGSKETIYNKDDGACDYVLNPLTDMMNDIFKASYTNDYFRPDLRKFLKPSKDKIELPKDYVVLGMGADSKQRMYPANQLKSVIDYLLEQKHNIVFLGRGDKDSEFIDELKIYIDMSNSNIYNLINKTTMYETLNIIRDSRCFLGVESGLWNCAYCLNTKSVVIYGGGHWGRFKHESSDIGYANVNLKCFNCDWECIYDNSKVNTVSCIRQVSPEIIIEELRKKGV